MAIQENYGLRSFYVCQICRVLLRREDPMALTVRLTAYTYMRIWILAAYGRRCSEGREVGFPQWRWFLNKELMSYASMYCSIGLLSSCTRWLCLYIAYLILTSTDIWFYFTECLCLRVVQNSRKWTPKCCSNICGCSAAPVDDSTRHSLNSPGKSHLKITQEVLRRRRRVPWGIPASRNPYRELRGRGRRVHRIHTNQPGQADNRQGEPH